MENRSAVPILHPESDNIVAAVRDASDHNQYRGCVCNELARFVTVSLEADGRFYGAVANRQRSSQARGSRWHSRYDLAESVRILADSNLSPVLPRAAAGTLRATELGWPLERWQRCLVGKLPEGHQPGKLWIPIFPGIEVHCKSGLV